MGEFRGWGGSALVTGASSGIGLELARGLAVRGLDLILVARSAGKLQEIAHELRDACGVRVAVVPCDLARPGTAEEMRDALGDAGRPDERVDLLVNNAAFGIYGRFGCRGADREAEMIRLNLVAPVLLTAHFLPGMIRRGRGVVMQVASTAAFAPVPYQGSYSGTKAHLVSWTHALDTELRGSGVRACVLCPGSTATGFHEVSGSDGGRERQLPWQGAAEVAREGLRGLDRGRRVIVSGRRNRIYATLARVVPPAWTASIAARLIRPKDPSPPA